MWWCRQQWLAIWPRGMTTKLWRGCTKMNTGRAYLLLCLQGRWGANEAMGAGCWIHGLSLLWCGLQCINSEWWANEAMGVGSRVCGRVNRHLGLLWGAWLPRSVTAELRCSGAILYPCLANWLARLPRSITAKLRCSGAILDTCLPNWRAWLPRGIAAKLWSYCAMLYAGRAKVGLRSKLLFRGSSAGEILRLRWCSQTTSGSHAAIKYRCLVLDYGRVEWFRGENTCIRLTLLYVA